MNEDVKKALEIIQKGFELKDINETIILLMSVASQYYYEYGASWQDSIFEREIKIEELEKKYFPNDEF